MTPRILVDSNVLLDVIKDDPVWGAWSAQALARQLERGRLVINAIVYEPVKKSSRAGRSGVRPERSHRNVHCGT